MRLMTGVLAAQPFESTLTGDDSLRKRPMNRVITPLEKMGADIEVQDGAILNADPEGIIGYVAVPLANWGQDIGYS